jgi:DNA-binding NarL/FixJ family response regulator
VTVRVVLADDQAVVRDGLRLLLTAGGQIDVLAVAVDGAEAVTAVLEHRPDVALLDLRMPALDGAQVTAVLAERAPDVRVLILTTFADDDAVLPALRAGAAGYLTKDASGETLVQAILDVAAGRTVLDPGVQRRLVELLREGAPAAPAAEPDAGGSARRLVLSEATVKTHLNHVLSKLDVDGRPGLVAWAWRRGLVQGD